ncbi:ribonuclease P protein component [Thiocystis violascens]|uniref:Ribonuclease P protein component n=1 Tax=Thiocystis violascens (strain ATCC 17096 / DSM 198 / 6111) TaxID=765911 RepID=I3YD24_THIV6|nr:ribonuclease P protein component [Thiocystis violascens]AFL74892.1 ribonuclease P protein component [Thiocystis violascens DSM 198]
MNPADSTGFPDNRFSREQRLQRAPQFRRVFAHPVKTGKIGFVVLYRANGLGHARIGLAISKKCARRAVDRNRLKRIARESFRTHRQSIPGVDIVILCSSGAPKISNQQLFFVLEQAWAIIRNQPCVES